MAQPFRPIATWLVSVAVEVADQPWVQMNRAWVVLAFEYHVGSS